MQPRAFDHLVMPTASLDAARARLERLGFTVAPEGVHPFGTRNACVYLADGTFMEPLAIGDRATVDAAIAAGNSFVEGDRRFRSARGDEGVSALVFATPDAEADHERFGRLGIGGGPMVEFSRPAIDAAGKADTATFRLAFAAHAAAPDLHFFTCERRRAPKIDRSALERHANGALRLSSVTADAADPQDFARFLALMAEADSRAGAQGGFEVALAGNRLRVRGASGMQGVTLTGIAFTVADLAAAASLFDAAGIAYERRENALRVPAAPGQGADFIFEDMR